MGISTGLEKGFLNMNGSLIKLSSWSLMETKSWNKTGQVLIHHGYSYVLKVYDFVN